MNEIAHERKFSARPALLLGFGGTIMLIAGVVGWSVMASISGAVIAPGIVGVENRNQTIEHIDGGTVSEILVRDGDHVVRDDVLVRFADDLLRVEESLLQSQYIELSARLNRLTAEVRGSDTIDWDEELLALASDNPDVREVLEGQDSLFHARLTTRNGELTRLREQIRHAEEEITGLEAQSVSFEQQTALIVQELESQRELYEQRLTRSSILLELERDARTLEGQAGANAAQIARIHGSIAEREVQILQIELRRVEESEALAREVSASKNEVRQRLASVRERLNHLEVRAPAAGEIFGMTVFSINEVVRPGEPILQIVPADARLVVIARIQPTDVDQVYPGQPALLRFSAFPANETPEFEGEVLRISADVVNDSNTGVSWYEVDLTLDQFISRGEIQAESRGAEGAQRMLRGLAITPGMPVEAHIQTASRSIIGYLVKPVSDFFYRALREE